MTVSRSRGIRWNSPAIVSRSGSEPGLAAVGLPRGAGGRAGDGVLVEQRWEADAAAWRVVLDELAGHAPAPDPGKRAEGFPADRAEAFDVYARARDEHEAAAGRAGGVADVTGLRAAEGAAAARLQVARGWLAAWGIPDAERAWQAARDFSADRATGLSAAGRNRRGRGAGRGGRGRGAGQGAGAGQQEEEPAAGAGQQEEEPLVAEVVAQWRALTDADREQTPLLGMLEQRLAQEGRPLPPVRGSLLLSTRGSWRCSRGRSRG